MPFEAAKNGAVRVPVVQLFLRQSSVESLSCVAGCGLGTSRTGLRIVCYVIKGRGSDPLPGNGDMKWQRLSLGSVIGLATGICAIYVMSIILQSSATVVFGLSVLAVVATAWMVLRILNDPHPTHTTFSDQFYQDRDDIRRNQRG